MKYVAYCVKGLEAIVEAEIKGKILDAQIILKQDKLIIFSSNSDLESLTKLRTVDDLQILLVNTQPESLLFVQLNDLHLDEVTNQIKRFREIRNSFSITTSIAKSKIDDSAVVEYVKKLLTEEGFIFDETSRTNLDFRIFLNNSIGIISLRITKEPLAKRSYQTSSYLGALKPTIASAMVELVKTTIPNKGRIVDSFSGSGTILAETYLAGYEVYGGDINPDAVKITTNSLNQLGMNSSGAVKLQNAIKTSWPSKYFDAAISNLPWDKQHEVDRITDLYVGALKEYHRILKDQFALCIICHKPELLIKHIKVIFGKVKIQQYKLGILGQTPTIVLVKFCQQNNL